LVIRQLQIDWSRVFDVKKVDEKPQGLSELLEKHRVVFEKGLGTLKMSK
jgi:hypothetical protein